MADGSRHSMYAVEESSYGVTPNDPALETVRITGTTLALNKDSLQSQEIRNDRMITDFRQGANQVNGDINFELSHGSFDKFLQGVLFAADWASPATTGTTTIDATTTGFTRATGDFTADGFAVGMGFVSAGFSDSNANGVFKITAVTALEITATPLQDQAQVNEAGGGDESLTALQVIKAGTTRKPFTFVRHFADITDKPYHIFTGVEINTIALQIAANSMITGTLGVIGKGQSIAANLSALGTPTYPTASTTTPLDSFTGELVEGGTVIGVVTEVTLNLDNGAGPRFVVGSKDSLRPSTGRSNLTGQVTAFFEDSVMLEKFINETESDIVMELPDADGNHMRIRIPRIKYTGAPPNVDGEGPITLAMPFQALGDTTEGTNLIIERYTAP